MPNRSARQESDMFSVEQLAVERGGRMIVRGIDLHLEAGYALQIHGANGSGKSTLLCALAGLLLPVKGKVCWHGADVRSQPQRFRRELSYMGHTNGVSDDLTVLENIRFARLLGAGRSTDDSAYRPHLNEGAVLKGAGLLELLHTRLNRLSQGQRRRVALARVMLSAKPLWLLDEPAEALDAAAQGWLGECIDAHMHAGGIVVSTTHRPLATASAHTHHLRLEGGGR